MAVEFIRKTKWFFEPKKSNSPLSSEQKRSHTWRKEYKITKKELAENLYTTTKKTVNFDSPT